MIREEIREDLKRYQINTDFEPSNYMYCSQVDFLLSECERLERDKDLKDYRLGDDYQKATLLIEQLSARVKDLQRKVDEYEKKINR